MKTMDLTENDCTFIYYTLRAYARQCGNLEQEDIDNIDDLANKFKN
jgi:hypothetical protein